MNQMQDDFNDRVTTISLGQNRNLSETYTQATTLHATRHARVFPLLVHVDRCQTGVNATCNLPFDHFDTFSIHPITSSPRHQDHRTSSSTWPEQD